MGQVFQERIHIKKTNFTALQPEIKHHVELNKLELVKLRRRPLNEQFLVKVLIELS